MRHVRAAQLDEVREAVAAGVWATAGFRSPTAWLMRLTGEPAGTCGATLFLAKRMAHMPLAREAFAAGRLSEAGLGLLARAWSARVAEPFARDEELLLRWTMRLAYRDAKVLVDTWVARADPERAESAEQERFDRRRLHVSEMFDGMVRGDFLLDPEGAAIVRDAIAYLSRPAADDTRTPAQRRADALVSMAKSHGSDQPEPADPADPAATAGAAETAESTETVSDNGPRPTRRRVPRLVATIDYADLVAGAGVGLLESGHSGPTVVSSAAIQRLACDAGIHRYVANAPDLKVHYGRQTRSISDPLYELLCLRDHGCRWPGCDTPSALCEGHHAQTWTLDHGHTEPDNLVLICWYHHHLLHEQRWRLQPLGAGHFQLHAPHGHGVELLRPPMVGPNLPDLTDHPR